MPNEPIQQNFSGNPEVSGDELQNNLDDILQFADEDLKEQRVQLGIEEPEEKKEEEENKDGEEIKDEGSESEEDQSDDQTEEGKKQDGSGDEKQKGEKDETDDLIKNIDEALQDEFVAEGSEEEKESKQTPQETSAGDSEEVTTLKNRVAQLENQQVKPPVQEEEVLKPTIPTVTAARLLLKANAGDTEENIGLAAVEELERHSAKDIADTLRRARRGEYGEESTNLTQVLSGFLETARLKESEQEEETKRKVLETEQVAQWQKQRNDSFVEVSSFPGMKDPKSDQYLKYKETIKVVKEQFPEVMNSSKAPLIVHKLSIANKMETYVKKLLEQNSSLKNQLNKKRVPQNVSGASSGGTSNKKDNGIASADKELKKEMAELTASGGSLW